MEQTTQAPQKAPQSHCLGRVSPCRTTRFVWKLSWRRPLTQYRLQPLSLIGPRSSAAFMTVRCTHAFRVEAVQFVNTNGRDRLASCARAPPSAPTTSKDGIAECAARIIPVSSTDASGINAASARTPRRIRLQPLSLLGRLLCPAHRRRSS